MEKLSVFDIIGPVMVGPSSSHTAGAARIGLEMHRRISGRIREIEVTLFNSFADTGDGHGTKMAILGGVLGLDTFDPRIKESFSMCEKGTIKFSFKKAYDPSKHPNSALIEVRTSSGFFTGYGESLGGGLANFREIAFGVSRLA